MKRIDLILLIEYLDNVVWFISNKCINKNLDAELTYIFTRLLSDISKWLQELRRIKDDDTIVQKID